MMPVNWLVISFFIHNILITGGYFASINDMANWAIGLDKNTLFPLDFANELAYNSEKLGNKTAEFSKVGWALENDGNIFYGGHSGGPGLGDVLRFPKEKITIITLSNDGELYPQFSRAIASWYIKGLSPKLEIKNSTDKYGYYLVEIFNLQHISRLLL